MRVIDDEPWLNADGSTVLRTAPSKGAVTGLSYPSTPGFPRCQLRQFSPCSPAVLPRPQKPSCAVPVALLRYAPGVGLDRLSPCSRSLGHYLPKAVSVSPNMHHTGLGRSVEFHLAAPVVAAPALLEACSFSACSTPEWRSGVCWIGDPAWPFGRVVCRWQSAR